MQGPPLLLCTAPGQTGATSGEIEKQGVGPRTNQEQPGATRSIPTASRSIHGSPRSCRAKRWAMRVVYSSKAKRHPCRHSMSRVLRSWVDIWSICKYCIHIVQLVSNAFPQSMVFNPNKANGKRNGTKKKQSCFAAQRVKEEKGLQYAADDVDDLYKLCQTFGHCGWGNFSCWWWHA